MLNTLNSSPTLLLLLASETFDSDKRLYHKILDVVYYIYSSNPCRIQKRQRVVDILLQVMVESIGFTVSFTMVLTSGFLD